MSNDRVVEYAVRVVTPPSAPSRCEVLARLRSGQVILESIEAGTAGWQVAQIHGLIHTLHDGLMSHLALTGGVQLSLTPPD